MLTADIMQIVMTSFMTSLEVKRSPILRESENVGYLLIYNCFLDLCKEMKTNEVVQNGEEVLGKFLKLINPIHYCILWVNPLRTKTGLSRK